MHGFVWELWELGLLAVLRLRSAICWNNTYVSIGSYAKSQFTTTTEITLRNRYFQLQKWEIINFLNNPRLFKADNRSRFYT